jgi:hypothetical protein
MFNFSPCLLTVATLGAIKIFLPLPPPFFFVLALLVVHLATRLRHGFYKVVTWLLQGYFKVVTMIVTTLLPDCFFHMGG